MSGPSAAAPLFLVTGSPSAEELAAVVAVLTARSAPAAASAARPVRPLWATPRLRRPLVPGSLVPGPGAWRASGLPG